MRDIHHFVNGQSLIGTSGRFGDVFNPSTGEIQARVQFATDAEMDLAVRAAAKAQIGWASTNPQRRARARIGEPLRPRGVCTCTASE